MKPKMTEKNSHLHKCANCGFVWRHLNKSPGRDNDEAHTCRCGFQQFFIEGKKGKANVNTCGRPAKKSDKPVPMEGCYEQDGWDKDLWFDPMTGDEIRLPLVKSENDRPDPA